MAMWTPDIPLVTFQHKTIDDLLADGNVTQDWIDRAFIFTFVRDPLERLESIWRHLKQGGRRQQEAINTFSSFKDFAWHVVETKPADLANYVDYARPQATTWATFPEVVFIGRFSHMQEDFAKLIDGLGIKAPKLTHHNASRNLAVGKPRLDDDLLSELHEHYAADYDLLERIGY
jgi:hypothetical protein